MKPQLTSGDWGFLRIESMFFALIINNFIVTVLLEFIIIININATHYSSANIRPSPGRTVRNPIAGSITNVRNGSVDFDSKPSCWSFIKRTLASLLRKIVSVCQAIPRAFVSLLPCCGRSVGSTPSTAVRCETQESSSTSNTSHLPKQHPTVCSESRKFDDGSSSFKKFRAMLDNDEIDWDWWESKTVEGPTNLISPEEVTMSTVQVYMAETEQTSLQKLKGNHERDSHNDDELIYKYHPEKNYAYCDVTF